jgi:hypothetical protein
MLASRREQYAKYFGKHEPLRPQSPSPMSTPRYNTYSSPFPGSSPYQSQYPPPNFGQYTAIRNGERLNHKAIGITFCAARLLRSNMTLVHPIAVIIQLSTLEEYNQSSLEPTIPIHFVSRLLYPISSSSHSLIFSPFITRDTPRFSGSSWQSMRLMMKFIDSSVKRNLLIPQPRRE